MDLELATFDDIAKELTRRYSIVGCIVARPLDRAKGVFNWQERFRYSGDMVALLGFLDVLRYNIMLEKERLTEPTEDV